MKHPDAFWLGKIEKLKEYKKRTGSWNVPLDYRVDPELGQFVQALREEHGRRLQMTADSNNNKKQFNDKALADDHYQQLSELGFDWVIVEEDTSCLWEVRFQQLAAFKAQFGHCRVPQKWEKNKSLGFWVSTQRKNYREMKKGRQVDMTLLERFARLESMGFEYLVRVEREGKSRDDLWMDQFETLKEYRQREGHARVPFQYKENPTLSNFCNKQKKYYRRYLAGKANPLTEERIELLKSVDFPFPNLPDGAGRWSNHEKKPRKRKSQSTDKKDKTAKSNGNAAAKEDGKPHAKKRKAAPEAVQGDQSPDGKSAKAAKTLKAAKVAKKTAIESPDGKPLDGLQTAVV